MTEIGFYHSDRGYWQATGDVPQEILDGYPEGTVEVPLMPTEPGKKFSWSGTEWVEAAPDLTALKVTRLIELRSACTAAITGGFLSEALGDAFSYPSTSNDQINLMGSVTGSILSDLPADWTTPFWCADTNGEWSFRPHTAAEIQQVGWDGKAHVVACQMKLETLSARLAGAASAAEVAAVSWDG